MRITPRAIVILLVFAAAPHALADANGTTMSRFVGIWSSNGDAFGSPARSRLTWQPTLGGQFYKLEYQIDTITKGETASYFSGIAYYRQDGKSGFWADSFGELHSITAFYDSDSLVAHWGRAGGKQGRTRYELLSVDRLLVTDWMLTKEGWRQFNKNTFSRGNVEIAPTS